MIEKYIELADRIKRGHGDDEVREGIDYALHWLDAHPDQAPGRTIAAGEVGRWSHLINGRYIETPSIIHFLEALGLTVVPDPEPTNTEKLRDLLDVADKANIGHNLDKVAAWLDEAGVIVTAPGGGE